MVEQLTLNQRVAGSSPARLTKLVFYALAFGTTPASTTPILRFSIDGMDSLDVPLFLVLWIWRKLANSRYHEWLPLREWRNWQTRKT